MKRRRKRIGMCLVLGLATSYAVAWGLALYASNQQGAFKYVTNDWRAADAVWDVSIGGPKWAMQVTSMRSREAPSNETFFDGKPEKLIPPWCPFDEPTLAFARGEITSEIRTAYAFGWPQPAAWHEIRSGRMLGGWKFKPPFTRQGQDAGYESLPMRPIWRGVAIDSILYTALWLGLLVGVPAIRESRRRERGHCPKCAYDLRGCPAGSRTSPRGCPECGWNREARETENVRDGGTN